MSLLLAIKCETEGGTIISNEMEKEAWDAITELAFVLGNNWQGKVLSSWKETAHLASAREAYTWREVLDSIKNSDLEAKCRDLEIKDPVLRLMKSKPIMLRVAAEITNALLHSYTLRHRITFFHIDSKEPSAFPT